jgi:hypothetical protein
MILNVGLTIVGIDACAPWEKTMPFIEAACLLVALQCLKCNIYYTVYPSILLSSNVYLCLPTSRAYWP